MNISLEFAKDIPVVKQAINGLEKTLAQIEGEYQGIDKKFDKMYSDGNHLTVGSW